jgi:hypothetical protein
MLNHRIHVLPADEVNYHEAAQVERVRRAMQLIDPGDLLAGIDQLISQEPDPTKHPCFAMAAWLLDQRLEPGDGGVFWDAWKRLACQALDTLLDDALEAMED